MKPSKTVGSWLGLPLLFLAAAGCSGGAANGNSCRSTPDCAAYEDGDLCNGTLVCSPQGACELDPATVIDCQEGGDCWQETCNGATGNCDRSDSPAGTVCEEDEDPCTLEECDGSGSCIAESWDTGCGLPPPETACEDELDNDFDGLTDCSDPDCSEDPACEGPVPFEDECDDDADNDHDGLTDCSDPDCSEDPHCT